MASDRQFVNRRLHSLLGVIPVGLFLVVHLTVNFYATKGPEAFEKAAEFMENLPFLVFLQIFVIYLPILFHAIYGVYIAFQSKNNVGNYGYFRNVMFMLQRVTGLITFVFVFWHVWETRIQILLGNKSLDFNLMADIVSNPWMLALYLIGLISTTFHFSNGLWSFLVSWGITVGPRAQRVSTYVTLVIFVLLSAIGVAALLAFANPSDVAGLY
jgi:succinate dehydrogenase / fumarate reductase cytochrome b subunit